MSQQIVPDSQPESKSASPVVTRLLARIDGLHLKVKNAPRPKKAYYRARITACLMLIESGKGQS